MTKTSPATNSDTTNAQKIGTVGLPIPGCTIRIASDGEVLVKGPMVSPGYWDNPGATKEMIDEDGWLHAGHLGALDDGGFLAITGRKKDLIITAAGKNVARRAGGPAAHPLAGQPAGDHRRRQALHRSSGDHRPRSRSPGGRPATASRRRRQWPAFAAIPLCGRRSRRPSTRPTRQYLSPRRSRGSRSSARISPRPAAS